MGQTISNKIYQLRKTDPDNLFSYNTAKIVRIRDRRLGLLYYLALAGIVFYIAIWVIILQKGYLGTEVPVGSVRLSFRRPYNAAGTNPQPTPVDLLKYCAQTAAETSTPYTGICPPPAGSSGGNINASFSNNICQYWDEQDAVYPPSEQSAITLTTRVSISTSNLTCDLSLQNCSFTTGSAISYYISDAESFTLGIDHTMVAPQRNVQRSARDMSGKLLDFNGNSVGIQLPDRFHTSDPNVTNGEFDIFRVSTVLSASGIANGLDSIATSDCIETSRSSGIVILMLITYDNTHSYDTNNFEYSIRPYIFPRAEFKAVEVIYLSDPDIRILRDRHGVRLLFVQTGVVGTFSFQALLLSFVSGLGLLAIATTVVDLIAVMIMPEKKFYSAYKYQTTVDFSDLRDRKITVSDDVQRELDVETTITLFSIIFM